MSETLLFSVHDHIATIAFNRPFAMNSFDETMGQELEKITQTVREDSKIRAVLLKGEGSLFMAGGDIQFFQKNLNTLPQHVLKIIDTLNNSIKNLTQMPKPVLASVHGSVAGVGMSFMLACDLVIASIDTKFTMAYSGIGISPDGGASYHLPRVVGQKKAMELILLSEIFNAQTALQYGLVNWVVNINELEENTNALLKRLVKGPTFSFAKTKMLMNETWNYSLDEQLQREAIAFKDCCETKDFKMGVESFMRKEKPLFQGE